MAPINVRDMSLKYCIKIYFITLKMYKREIAYIGMLWDEEIVARVTFEMAGIS